MSPRPAIPALAAAAVTGVVLAARWAATRRERWRTSPPEPGVSPAGAARVPQEETARADGVLSGGAPAESAGAPAGDEQAPDRETLDQVGRDLSRYWDRLRPLYPDQHS